MLRCSHADQAAPEPRNPEEPTAENTLLQPPTQSSANTEVISIQGIHLAHQDDCFKSVAELAFQRLSLKVSAIGRIIHASVHSTSQVSVMIAAKWSSMES